MLGVSRPIYVNVDSPNLGFPYFNTQVSGDGPRFLTDSDTKTVTVAGGNHDNYHIG